MSQCLKKRKGKMHGARVKIHSKLSAVSHVYSNFFHQENCKKYVYFIVTFFSKCKAHLM